MAALPSVRNEMPQAQRSGALLALDRARDTGPARAKRGWLRRIPGTWIGMAGYLMAGVFLGLVLIVALTATGGDRTPALRAGQVTDNVVRVFAHDIGEGCRAATAARNGAVARLTVSMEIGLDGKVRSAVAAGESPALRGCVESHVKGWEFLPQATASQMVLPIEIDPR